MFKSKVDAQNASKRCLTLLIAVLTSLLSYSASYGTDITKPFPFTEVIKKDGLARPERFASRGNACLHLPRVRDGSGRRDTIQNLSTIS